jgi:futalosine hydrolase
MLKPQDIIIIAATPFEIETTVSALSSTPNGNIQCITTGVGILATAVNLCKIIHTHTPNLIIQAGIAGAYNTSLKLGETVAVKKEYITDLGVQEPLGWKDVFDLGFENKNTKPFKNKALINTHLKKLPLHLPLAIGATVNQVSTQKQQILTIYQKYSPDIETMEGAALHYVCNTFNVPYLQIRSISNYIGERDKNKWKIKLAIKNLNKELGILLKTISK